MDGSPTNIKNINIQFIVDKCVGKCDVEGYMVVLWFDPGPISPECTKCYKHLDTQHTDKSLTNLVVICKIMTFYFLCWYWARPSSNSWVLVFFFYYFAELKV